VAAVVNGNQNLRYNALALACASMRSFDRTKTYIHRDQIELVLTDH